MYRGFNLKDFTYDIDRQYYKVGKAIQEIEFFRIKEAFENYFINNKYLDGSEIMSEWFPIKKGHIFLSHSHKDLDLALSIAGLLKNKFNLEVFVDSTVWLNSSDLLKIIDNRFTKNIDGLNYNYEKRNYSTSHVHIMLMSSLNKMIDNCEALFFLNTPNSLHVGESIREHTFSPWIYSEIETSKIINKKTPERLLPKTKIFSDILEKAVMLNESTTPELQIAYKMGLDHLIDIDYWDFNSWINSSAYSPHNALDNLYKENQLENIKIN